MEIAGYDIPDKYVLAGGGILLVGGFLLSKRGGETTKEIAELRPAEGLTWQDIIGTSDEGKLIGPGGPLGESGPPGTPGTPGIPGTPSKKHKKHKDKDGDNDKPNNRNGGRDGGRDDDRNRDRDDGNTLNNRPRMPHTRDDNKHIDDPRLDTPKDRARRNESRNRVDNGRSRRIDDDRRVRTETPIRVNPRTGAIRHPDRDRTRRDRDRDREDNSRANGNADGGTVTLGDIDKGTHLNINVDGGREIERDSGRRDRERRRVAGRAGYGVAGIESDGYGRLDGRDGSAEGFVRTNISPGSTTGSFMPGPQALSGRTDTLVIRKGETLKGLSKRAYGDSHFWPRVVTLNNRVLLPEGEIPAGTKIRI